MDVLRGKRTVFWVGPQHQFEAGQGLEDTLAGGQVAAELDNLLDRLRVQLFLAVVDDNVVDDIG